VRHVDGIHLDDGSSAHELKKPECAEDQQLGTSSSSAAARDSFLPSSRSSRPQGRVENCRIRGNLAAMSTTDKKKELKEARAKAASMVKAIESELNKELAALPARYGFGSVADFFAAVTKAMGKRGMRKAGKNPTRPATGGKGNDQLWAVLRYKTPAERSRLTIAGLEAARRRGTRLGRPPLDPKTVRRIHAAASRMGHHVRAIARKIQVPPSTVYRVLARGR
jgi:hypothetical protein